MSMILCINTLFSTKFSRCNGECVIYGYICFNHLFYGISLGIYFTGLKYICLKYRENSFTYFVVFGIHVFSKGIAMNYCLILVYIVILAIIP